MKSIVVATALGSALFFQSTQSWAKDPELRWGLFLDSYYAFDGNRPTNRERLYTTLPAKHNEFAINLAHVEGVLSADRVRGRLALQAGTSVAANYSTEYRDTTKTGGHPADLLQHLQEATAGYRLAEGLWVDAGIYFSHIGSETFISKNNWTYTRSLIADFSPYYQAGVRLSYDPNPQWAFQLHVLNGWQNILETNSDKALGTQVAFKPTKDITITHNTFLGEESGLRFFQDLSFVMQVLPWLQSGLTVDFGVQGRTSTRTWYGSSFQNRFRLASGTHLAARVEIYNDPKGVIVPTGTPDGFKVWGVSVNMDQQLTPELLWRNEVRLLKATEALFPSAAGSSSQTVFAITSLSLSL
jgi:hypothetical protein